MLLHCSYVHAREMSETEEDGRDGLKKDWNCLKFIVVDVFPATLVTPCVS